MTASKIVLNFPKDKIDKPVVYRLIKDFDLSFNIMKASITPDQEGHMVLELSGEAGNVDKGIKYLKEQGISVEPLSKDIRVNWDKCSQCTACVSICPTGALHIKDRATMEVAFDSEKCIACELCIKPCPPRAIEVHF
ncbi:(Fe-S)-binding protein [candidate division WOR-1 bacterium RIFOXYB2_FULL_42_35]|uniref:(Fe-S)-binding protein n=1 Tax=candidate division WOR-1 bacterium RIFOXYC2_FULL_41_25 TaxID=1802586 RepID=A0A1F4TLL1_UNCSA|nr:MAG: (Fe-S)-binding protein [candidate division WOR-1 bacterium RIFOXYA2_FULL_41_14]OGC22939.1 MAG: (Fe-S)-binding protein [candidate division WOR-1 bacterium RIFOXYB2_FULL_42_35]OGC33420.1 MAG: (Fe-S)-binding protein [candidate division WOR-1 bacterium RIFOXYC2_FULL_41_25]